MQLARDSPKLAAAKIESEVVRMKNKIEIEARRKIGWAMANTNAAQFGIQKLFLESRQWPGYKKAHNSWERALWKWADFGILLEKFRWRKYLLENSYLFPPSADIPLPISEFDVERGFQTYLLRRAVFLGRPANRQKNNPDWWKRFAFFLHLASQLNDGEVSNRLVQLTRKSAKISGKRVLLFWLRMFWFPGCLWAFTNNGISALVARSSDAGDAFYSEGSIKNAICDLKLWRPVKPLFWGLDNKKQSVSLR